MNPRLLLLLSITARFALPAAAAAGSATAAVSAATAEMAPGGEWSRPAILDDCPGTGAPYVVFPEDKPTHATGPGAIVWSDSSPCPGGAGAQVAAVSPEDIPGQPTRPRTAAGRTIPLSGRPAATAGPYGRIVIAGASAGGSTAPVGGLLLTEGPAGGPFTAPLSLGGPASPFAFTTAYLGDVALVSPAGGLQLRVQRHHAGRFAAPAQVTAADAGGPIDALTVALDFRSDRLTVWSQRGSVYARELPATGAPHPVQRLGPGPPSGARIAAVASDDDRAIVAWTYRNAGQTSVYVSRSETGVRFGAPQLLERFPDPPGLPAYLDSPRIVRLSSESVMLAWTGAQDGHWVIRTAPIDLHGVRTPDTISPPGRDALLADLATGPDDEALALWTEPQPTPAGLDLDSQAIIAARGFDAYPGHTAFAAAEQIAPPGPNNDATLALDPASDRAIAAWRTGAGLLAYSIRAP